MTESFDVPPPRPEGGPRVRPRKPPPDVLIRRPNGDVVLITEHVRRLWDLLEDAVRYHRLNYEDMEAALALGILAKFPVAQLQQRMRQIEQDGAAEVERQRQRQVRNAWLAELVMVTAAHPFEMENDPYERARPGREVVVTRGYAQRLDRAAMILRPCPHVYAGEPA